MSEQKEQPASGQQHQVLANGQVIYSGPDWKEVFWDAGMNPAYRTIEHRVDGEKQAIMGPRQPSQRHCV